MSNRNKSVAPYQGGGGMVPRDHHHRGAAFDEFDRMADRMMANFGMPKMDLMMPFGGRDPFGDDPFFADSGFGRIDQMMQNMKKDMGRVMNSQMQMGSMGGPGGQGHFVQQTFVSSTKLDAAGRPIQEKYQNKVAGAIGNGNKVVERQQMYDNTGTGMQKASHERMLNDKGRKVVKERLGNQMNTHDHYKNMREEEADQFDTQWGQMAGQLGLKSSIANNRLGYGGGSQQQIGGFNQGRQHNAIAYDDDRRGAYFDGYSRGANMPVNYNRQASDIGPTQPAPRTNGPIAMGNGNPRAAPSQGAPLALTDGRQPVVQHRQATNNRVQNNNNFAVSRTTKGPARAD